MGDLATHGSAITFGRRCGGGAQFLGAHLTTCPATLGRSCGLRSSSRAKRPSHTGAIEKLNLISRGPVPQPFDCAGHLGQQPARSGGDQQRWRRPSTGKPSLASHSCPAAPRREEPWVRPAVLAGSRRAAPAPTAVRRAHSGSHRFHWDRPISAAQVDSFSTPRLGLECTAS